MVPDGQVYDIAVISEARFRKLTGTASLQELGFRLDPGTRFEDIRYALTDRLTPYGIRSLLSRKDQTSFAMVEDEKSELTTTGTILPIIFLSISVFMLYVVLQKMIDRDRSLIGTMKAFGMQDRELLSAYLLEGAAIGLGGALLGGLTAGGVGRFMFGMYVDFFNLPDTVYHDYLRTRLAGAGISLAVSLAAVLLGVREVLHITPAMAMRAQSPDAAEAFFFRLPGPFRWLAGLFGHLSGRQGRRMPAPAVSGRAQGEKQRSGGGFVTKMGLRSLLRNPFRDFLIMLSVAFPFAMSSVLLSYGPLIDEMLEIEFQEVEAYDILASLDGFVTPERAEAAGRELPGVREAEGAARLSVELFHDGQQEFAILSGREGDTELWRIRDNEGIFLQPPSDGLLLNARISKKLHAVQGDIIEVIIPGLAPNRRKVRVSGVVEEMFGSGCYLDLRSFPTVLGIDPCADTVLLQCGAGSVSTIQQKLLSANRVKWIVDIRKTDQVYRDMFGSMTIMIEAFSYLAVIAGAILIYNILMINVRERVTELVTLRVLGAENAEIGRMLLLEQMILFAGGILLGIPGHLWIRKILESMMVSDSYTIRMHWNLEACIRAFLICLMMALAAWYRECRLVNRISLTDALKARE